VSNDDIERGRTLFESGKYAKPLGKYLGRLESWGLDVFEGSPQAWKDELIAEYRREQKC
jgi:hypothetical protein